MWLTRLCVERPTMIFVLLALIAVVGTLGVLTITQQQFPNVDFPTVGVRASYPGGSTTEIRDAIVRPIEDAIAGAPNLDTFNTTVQQGQASITARLDLSLEQDDRSRAGAAARDDRAIATAERHAGADGRHVRSGAGDGPHARRSSSRALSRRVRFRQSSRTTSCRRSNRSTASRTSTSAARSRRPSKSQVNPHLLSSAGFTLNDIVSSIQSNNNREPGGIAYLPNRETTIDVRGDVTTQASVANLSISAASQYTTSFGNASYSIPVVAGVPGAPPVASSETASVAREPGVERARARGIRDGIAASSNSTQSSSSSSSSGRRW